MLFDIMSIPKKVDFLAVYTLHLPAGVFGLCHTTLTSNKKPLYYVNNFDFLGDLHMDAVYRPLCVKHIMLKLYLSLRFCMCC